jgi:ribosomal protein S18 acetylase RimI-like enzyme
LSSILTDFSSSGLARAIEANQIGHLANLGRSPQMTLHQDPELTWLVSGHPMQGFNRVLRAQFEADDIDAKIEATLARFKSRGVPLHWHTGPTTRPADLGRRLVSHGLAPVQNEPGMAVDLLTLHDAPRLPPHLSIERVIDVRALRIWVQAFARIFGLSDRVREAIFSIEASLGLAQNRARQLYIGYWRGEPLATAMLFLGAGVAGIYAIGTDLRARRQGIGLAMTLVPLLEARAIGYRIGTLHSSPMGLGIYRRLGFQEHCRLGMYSWTGQAGRRVL